jgi:hypothetical protein
VSRTTLRTTFNCTGPSSDGVCASCIDPNRLEERPILPPECAPSRKLAVNDGGSCDHGNEPSGSTPGGSTGELVKCSALRSCLVTNKCQQHADSPAGGELWFRPTTMLMAAEHQRAAGAIRLRFAAGCITLRRGWCLIHETRVRIPEQLLRRTGHVVPDTCVATCQAVWSKWPVLDGT